MTVLTELSTSQQALLDGLGDPECAQYFTTEGLELHDVAASALLGAVVSIVYPYPEVQSLEEAGLVRLVTPEEDPFSDRPYYVTA